MIEYPHLYRRDFVSALALHGPEDRPRRRFLMVLSAMADHWSVVRPDAEVLSGLFSLRLSYTRDWLDDFRAEGWLSDVPDTDLALLHLPEHSPAFRSVKSEFEWHTRSHAPVAPFLRVPAATTPVNLGIPNKDTPLTARAPFQLAESLFRDYRRGQFAYISFLQRGLVPQPTASREDGRELFPTTDY